MTHKDFVDFERSFVTVLVADTVNSTGQIADLDPDDVSIMLDPLFYRVKSAVDDAGGILVSLNGDGGVALFGWPGSLENHADQACRAAWEIQQAISDAVDGAPRQMRVGVHSGLVGIRQMMLDTGERLDLVGGTVHLAAALEKKAGPGDVLVSSSTLGLCRNRLVLAPAEAPASLSQIGGRAYRLRARPRRSDAAELQRRYRNPMVGRHEECAAIRAALHSGRPRAIAIAGEPGIGKSRLMVSALELAQEVGRPVVVASGDPHLRQSPFTLIRRMTTEALYGDPGAVDDALMQVPLFDGVDDEERARLQSALHQIKLGVTDPQDNRRRNPLFYAYARVLTFAVGRSNALLVIDDLQFADPESLRCLKLFLADRSEQLALLMTARPEAAAVATDLGAELITLGTLARDEMVALADSLPVPAKPPAQALSDMIARSDGVPFILEQAVYAFIETGGGSQDALPQGVASLIHARLNTLSQSAKWLAQSLGTLGLRTEREVAQRVAGSDDAQFERDLAELNSLGLLHPDAEDLIEFRHAILSEACATMLQRSRRKQVHRAAVEAIRALDGEMANQFERLAYHCEQAGDDAAALEWYWQECDRAHRRLATGSLVLLFEKAVACIRRIGPEAEDRLVDFALIVFAAMIQLGEITRMREHLPQISETTRRRGNRAEICAALCQEALLCWFDGTFAKGRRLSEEALKHALALDSVPLIFAAQFNLATMHFGEGALAQAIDVARNLADRLSGDLEDARLGAVPVPGSIVRSYLAWFLMETGEHDAALDMARHALEIAERTGESYSEALANIPLGHHALVMGDNDPAVLHFDRTSSLADRYGYDAVYPSAIGLKLRALARGGRLAEAEAILAAGQTDRRLQRTGKLELHTYLTSKAEVLFRLGQEAGAGEALTRAERIAEAIDSPVHAAASLRVRIWHEKRRHGPAATEAAHRRLDAICARHGLAAGR